MEFLADVFAQAETSGDELADEEAIARALETHVDDPVTHLLEETKELADVSRIGGGASQ